MIINLLNQCDFKTINIKIVYKGKCTGSTLDAKICRFFWNFHTAMLAILSHLYVFPSHVPSIEHQVRHVFSDF